jgi:hypothetical protein
MASTSRSRSGLGKASVTVLPLTGRDDAESFERYITATPSSSSSLDLIQATKKHLLSCGWRIKQDCNGVFFVSQENKVIRELMEACAFKWQRDTKQTLMNSKSIKSHIHVQEKLRCSLCCL